MIDYATRQANPRLQISLWHYLLLVAFAGIAFAIVVAGIRQRRSGRAEYEAMQGDWELIESHEIGIVSRRESSIWRDIWEIRGNSVTRHPGGGEVEFRLHSQHSPTRITFSPGPHGILRLDGERLMIHVTGEHNPLPRNFQPAKNSLLLVFRRCPDEG